MGSNAVASVKRAASLPNVPTTIEAGFPDTEYPYWNALFVPAKTPKAAWAEGIE